MATMQGIEMLEKQMKLLEEWNEANISNEPEQVRRNIETLIFAEHYLSDGEVIFSKM